MDTGNDRLRTAAAPREQAARGHDADRRQRRPRRPRPQPSPVTGRVPPSAAVLSRPFLVLLPVLTLFLPALLVALARQPTHTAEARVLVGGFDVEAQAVPGFVEASRTLASTFARLVGTPAIVDPVAEALDLEPGAVAGHIDATSVPESSIIRVLGTADSAEEAIRYADAAAGALLDYAASTGQNETDEDVLAEYQAAASENAAAQTRLAQIESALQASPSDALRTQRAEAKAAADAASLRANTLAEQYSQIRRNQGGTGQFRLVAPAAHTGDNRRSTVQLAIGASIGLGLVAGVALATVVVNMRTEPPARDLSRRS